MPERCEDLSGVRASDFDCGHVGCCESSPREHATAHDHGTQHQVMRSIMSGDSWDWCYVHELAGELT